MEMCAAFATILKTSKPSQQWKNILLELLSRGKLDTLNSDSIVKYTNDIAAYTIFSYERENRVGGGVMLYIPNYLYLIYLMQRAQLT